MKIAIVGAGIMGRTLAWLCAHHDIDVTLFERNPETDQNSCSFAAAGMMAPFSELQSAPALICEMGIDGIGKWKEWFCDIDPRLHLETCGTVLCANQHDADVLNHSVNKIMAKNSRAIISPHTDRELLGYHIEDEAFVDVHALMTALIRHQKIKSQFSTQIDSLTNLAVTYDYVIDARGIAAKADWKNLYAVRGELLWVSCPNLHLQHMTRFLHARGQIYVVPLHNDLFIIGASEIVCEDYSPISVYSCLQLLTALYAFNKEFSQARIIRTVTACRPAFSSHLPRIKQHERIISINGLFRHGYMLAPVLAQDIIAIMQQRKTRYVEHLH